LLHQIKPEFQMPRACPVELHVWGYIAANVNLHGTRPWHPSALFCFMAVDPEPAKQVAE
jgi:hypothetical protein